MLVDYKGILKILIAAAVLFALSLPAGCQSSRYTPGADSVLEQNWGRSFEAMKYNQAQNPEGPRQPGPAPAIDGRAATGAVEQYRQGFYGQQTGNVYNLNLQMDGLSR